MSTRRGAPDESPDSEAGDSAAGSPGTAAQVRDWFAARLPAGWFTAAPALQVDREEIILIGALADPGPEAGSDAERALAARAQIRRFREETRSRRIEIAREAEHQFRRTVSWGVACGGLTEMFTTLSVPVMTRLRQPERR